MWSGAVWKEERAFEPPDGAGDSNGEGSGNADGTAEQK
jgi:hypothetical protein